MSKREFVLRKIREEAFLEGEFVLSSGQKSNFYIDVKKVSFTGDFLDAVGDMICDIAEKLNVFDFCGVELGGVPLVCSAIIKMNQRGFSSRGIIIRKGKKDYGTSKLIEGPSVSRVIFLEDVITTGKTTLEGIEILRQNKIEVSSVIAVVDRGGGKNIIEKGFRFFALFSFEEIKNFNLAETEQRE